MSESKFISDFRKNINLFAVKFSIVKELMNYLWSNKLWWAMPIIFIIFILMIILLFGQSTGLAPFIYPIF